MVNKNIIISLILCKHINLRIVFPQNKLNSGTYIGQVLMSQYVITVIVGYAKRSKIILQYKNYENIVADRNA